MKRFILLSAFSALFLNTLWASLPTPIIQSGHNDAVLSLLYSSSQGAVVSGGEDGRVKVWNAASSGLVCDIRVSHLPVEQVILHPSKPQFVAMVKTGFKNAVLYAYNWEENRELFSIPLNEIPLFLTYSAKGTFILYSRAEWNSIMVYDSANGKKKNLLSKGFGIVSFMATSASENRVMMYQPSGKIIYKDLNTGEDILEKNTLANVNALSMASNNRFIAGIAEKNLVILDLLSGKTVSSADLSGTAGTPNILSTLFEVDRKEIVCLVKNEKSRELVRYFINGAQLQRIKEKPTGRDITAFTYIKDRVFFADSKGEILSFPGDFSENDFVDAVVVREPDEPGIPAESPEEAVTAPKIIDIKKYRDDLSVFAAGKLLDITAVAFSRDLLAIGTEKFIVVLEQKHLNVNPKVPLEYSVFENPLGVPVGLDFYKPNKLLVWSKGNSKEDFYILDISTGEEVDYYSDYSSPLIQLEIIKSGLLSLEASGMSRIIDKRTFEPQFQYMAMGLNKIIYVPDDNILLAARSKTSQAGSSLFKINPTTGETVPLSSEGLLCYDLVFDESRSRLFSLSINKEEGKPNTYFKMHFNKGFEKEKILFQYDNEDLSAALAIDEEGKNVYTSLGYDSIRVYNGSGVSLFAKSEDIPRKLFVSGDLLFALNRNGSLTIWNRFSRKKSMDLYLIKSSRFEWVAVLPSGLFYSSGEGDNFVLYNTAGLAIR